MSVSVKLPRSPRWTQDELNVLADAVLMRQHILFGEYSSELHRSDKALAWEEVAYEVSALGFCIRNAQQCRDKVIDAKSTLKKKYGGILDNDNNLTGEDGSSMAMQQFSDVDLKFLSLLGRASLHGIDGVDQPQDPLFCDVTSELGSSTTSVNDLSIDRQVSRLVPSQVRKAKSQGHSGTSRIKKAMGDRDFVLRQMIRKEVSAQSRELQAIKVELQQINRNTACIAECLERLTEHFCKKT